MKVEMCVSDSIPGYALNPRKNDRAISNVDTIVKRWEDYTGRKAVNNRTNKTYKEMCDG